VAKITSIRGFSYAILERANALHMSGMRQNRPGIASEFLPLGKKIIAHMVTNLKQNLSMGGRNFVDMGSVDD